MRECDGTNRRRNGGNLHDGGVLHVSRDCASDSPEWMDMLGQQSDERGAYGGSEREHGGILHVGGDKRRISRCYRVLREWVLILSKHLKSELDKLALSIAQTANAGEINLSSRLDAFKALTAYHIGLTKVGKKSGEDDKPKGESFHEYRKSIETSGD